MSSRISFRRIAAVVVAGVAATLVLGGCGGTSEGSSTGGNVESVLSDAKKNFDAASSVHFTLSTSSKPTSGDAVLGAEGTLTHQPAFEGEVTALYMGFNATIPVISVDGKVYGKIPFTNGFSDIDPGDYSAPDPADFADPETGISGLLVKLADPAKGDQERDGSKVVTTYTGTLAGDLVAAVIPSAAKDSTYQTVVGIDQDGRVATLKITGDFFPADGEVTYDISFDDYDKNVTISAP